MANVVNPKVWLHHHIGNDWACTLKTTSSDNIYIIIIWRRCGTGSEIRSSTEQTVLENKDTANIFLLTPPLSVQEEGYVPTIHALMAQDRYVAQWAYITPKQLTGVYDTRKNSPAVPGVQRRHAWKLQNEVDHWKAIWEMVNVAEKPDTLDDSLNQPRPILQHVHCCHSTDGDVYIDSHGRSPLQRYAASQELSALYNDKWAHVGTGLDARPQGPRVGCWTHHSSVQSSEEQALSPII